MEQADSKRRAARNSRAALERHLEETRQWHARPYDGFHGRLPEWVPPIFGKVFELARSRIAVDLEYKTDACPAWLDAFAAEVARYVTEGIPSMTGTDVPGRFRGDIEILHWIREAVRAGKESGLQILLGREPTSFIVARPAASKAGGEARSEKARKENQPIIEAATRLRTQEQHRRASVAHLAALIERQGVAPGRTRNAIEIVLRRYFKSQS